MQDKLYIFLKLRLICPMQHFPRMVYVPHKGTNQHVAPLRRPDAYGARLQEMEADSFFVEAVSQTLKRCWGAKDEAKNSGFHPAVQTGVQQEHTLLPLQVMQWAQQGTLLGSSWKE